MKRREKIQESILNSLRWENVGSAIFSVHGNHNAVDCVRIRV